VNMRIILFLSLYLSACTNVSHIKHYEFDSCVKPTNEVIDRKVCVARDLGIKERNPLKV
jgi:hypothetical protein